MDALDRSPKKWSPIQILYLIRRETLDNCLQPLQSDLDEIQGPK